MVKTPRARHSSKKKEPVTIELGPEEVSRLTDSPTQPEMQAGSGPSTPPEEDIAATAETPETEEEREEYADLRGAENDAGEDRPRGFRAGSFDSWDAEAASAPSEEAPRPAQRNGIGPALAAGVAGGVIALAIAGALQWAGLIPALGGSGNDAPLQSLRSEVEQLRQRVASFDQGAVNASTIRNALAPVNKRIDGLAGEVGRLKSDAADAKSAAATGVSAGSAALKDVQDRLAKLEQSVSAASKAAPSTEAVDALGRKVDTLGQKAAGNSETLQKLQADVEALNKKVAEQASEPRATAAVAASALKSAIDNGGSFSAELEMFAAAAPDAPELDQLRQLAAKGVPTRAQLASRVGQVADRMLEATRAPADGDAGVLGRLLDSARSLVKVRPVGKAEGDSVPARITRFENAVTAGDLARAADEYNSLPEKAKAAGAGFMTDLEARLKVDQLAQKALAGALKKG
jgi:hypothetical protein